MDRACDPSPRRIPAPDVRALRAAGVAGLLFAGLLTTSLALLRFDAISADDVGSDGLVRVSPTRGRSRIYLIPFAGIAFLWFLAVLRRRIGRGEDQFFATVFLGSGLLFIAMLFAAGATAGAAVGCRTIQQPVVGNRGGRARGCPGRDPVLRVRDQDGRRVHARVVDHRTTDRVPAPLVHPARDAQRGR